MQSVAILGATGSVGQQTLAVLRLHPTQYDVQLLCANSNVADLFALCREFQPRHAVLTQPEAAASLRALCREAKLTTQIHSGMTAIRELVSADEIDVVVAAIVGSQGLDSTMAAVTAGKTVLLANKEALVMAGSLMMDAVRKHGARLLPLDSEHNAILQCLDADYICGQTPKNIASVYLTASGGPFMGRAMDSLHQVTPDDACAHPCWSMGRKISVDSATMMNKGLELIEAHHLFTLPTTQLDAVIHPQSIVHGIVSYTNGAVLAALSSTDMRLPIAVALGLPDKIESGVMPLDITSLSDLTFQAIKPGEFPCFDLALTALQTGGAAPIILNAANEVANDAFLAGELNFTAIAAVIAEVLSALTLPAPQTMTDVLAIDAQARTVAIQQLRVCAQA